MDIIYRFDPYAPIQLKRPRNNKESLKMLEEGNARFANQVNHIQSIIAGDATKPAMVVPMDAIQLGIPIVKGLEQMHSPFALFLGCADARVPIERIMDCSANDLFVVRVAGNVLGLECLGSVDYAVTALRSSLQSVIVLGHTGCGAVSAAVDMYLSPSGFADIAFSHPVRTLIDRIMLAVHNAAGTLDEAYGTRIQKTKHYRDWLITTSCFLNSAVTAFDLQREVNAVSKGLQVSFTVYDMAWSRIDTFPIQGTEDIGDGDAFRSAPKTKEDLQEYAMEVVRRLKKS
jgi:carbonic anhydrase